MTPTQQPSCSTWLKRCRLKWVYQTLCAVPLFSPPFLCMFPSSHTHSSSPPLSSDICLFHKSSWPKNDSHAQRDLSNPRPFRAFLPLFRSSLYKKQCSGVFQRINYSLVSQNIGAINNKKHICTVFILIFYTFEPVHLFKEFPIQN